MDLRVHLVVTHIAGIRLTGLLVPLPKRRRWFHKITRRPQQSHSDRFQFGVIEAELSEKKNEDGEDQFHDTLNRYQIDFAALIRQSQVFVTIEKDQRRGTDIGLACRIEIICTARQEEEELDGSVRLCTFITGQIVQFHLPNDMYRYTYDVTRETTKGPSKIIINLPGLLRRKPYDYISVDKLLTSDSHMLRDVALKHARKDFSSEHESTQWKEKVFLCKHEQ